MGINNFYGHFMRGIILFYARNNNKKHQKFIYSTQLKLKTLKYLFPALSNLILRWTKIIYF
jgi:hypothetical protein